MVSKEAVQSAVAAYFAALSALDPEPWLANFSDDVLSFSPVGAPVIEGRDGMRLLLKLFSNAMSRIEVREEYAVVCGDCAAVKWVAEGVARNGRAVSFEGISCFEVDDAGKIRRIFAYWDPDAVTAAVNG